MTIAAILKYKGSEVYSVWPTDTVAEVARSLFARRIGAVVVLDPAGELLGILSERDIVYAFAVDGERALRKTAAQLMTRSIRTATPQTTAGEALAIMTAGRFRHLPVLDGGVLVGMVSIGDVVKHRIMQHETEVDMLRAYVSGADYSAKPSLGAGSADGGRGAAGEARGPVPSAADGCPG